MATGNAADFVQLLASANINNPTLNEQALNLFLQDFLGAGQQDTTDASLREAIASNMLQTENPDYLKIQDVLKGAPLEDLFPKQSDQSPAQQAAIESATTKGQTQKAAELGGLTAGQYEAYQSYKPKTKGTIGEAVDTFKQVTSANKDGGVKGALKTINPFNIVNALQESGREEDRQRQAFLNQLLRETPLASGITKIQ